MNQSTITTLYRPVGVKELDLILGMDAKGFPPRLFWQPIFYPVLNFQYAAQIARDWNTVDENSGFAGFVTKFMLPTSYLNQFPVQTVGAQMHQELWVPAEKLDEFNQNIVQQIEIVGAYFGEKYDSDIHQRKTFLTHSTIHG